MRDRIPAVSFRSGGRLAEGLAQLAKDKAQPKERVQELIALGDELIAGPKGYLALGAFNGRERTKALDMLGFHRQLVFSTFSAAIAFRSQEPIDVRYAAARAHNRAMADFCKSDPRLLGVAALPLDDPQLALQEIAHFVKLGLRAAWVPASPVRRPLAGPRRPRSRLGRAQPTPTFRSCSTSAATRCRCTRPG